MEQYFITINVACSQYTGLPKMTIDMSKSGAIWPFEVPVSHSWIEIGALLATIQEHKIKTFFELGVEHGGLMALLVARAHLCDDFRYIGIDRRNIVYPRVLRFSRGARRSQFYVGDVFSETVIGIVRSHLDAFAKPAMIYCDNGDKAKELETYAPLLASSDLIAAHDFTHEFDLEDIDHIEDIEHIEPEWVKGTRIILFRKINDNN